jgi:putative ABC transport system permease protein
MMIGLFQKQITIIMLLYNLKLVFRNLLKNKLYSFLSITGFAVGFAVCIVIALYAYNEYTVDHSYQSYNRIYRLIDEKKKRCTSDYNLNAILASNNPEVESACPFECESTYEFPVKYFNRYVKSVGAISTNNDFFKVFSLRIIKSMAKDPFADKKSVIITESLAKKLFGKDEDPLGKSINIFCEFDAIISAISEDLPINISIAATVFLNSENEQYRFNKSCSNHHCINPVNHYLLLSKEANSSDFAKKLNQNISSYKFAIDSIGLQKLSEIYLKSSFKDNDNLQGNKNLTIVFIAIGVLIMMLSTINYLNYNLSLQYSKLREIGIKRINGAELKHLIGYFVTDVSVGILISIDFALLVVGFFLSNINSLLGKQLNLDSILSPIVLISSTGVVFLIILVNSLAPFYILSKSNTSSFFTGNSLERGQHFGRNFLTTLQFVSAIALLICVFVIQKQLDFAHKADLGFDKEHLVKLSIPTNFTQQQVLIQEINKLPFIVGSTLSSGSPGNIGMGLSSNDSTIEKFMLATLVVDDNFIKTMNIELVDGRRFLASDKGETCIMNQEAIKQFGWSGINNKRFNNGRDVGLQVIGIVKDFHIASIHEVVKPVCIIYCSTDEYKTMYDLSIRITPGDVENKIKQIEKVWKTVIPDDPMDFTFYDTMFDVMYRKEKLLATIIMIFSAIAIVLSCMGILGQVFQTCINRTKEIGIRKVNGASVWTIIRMLNFDFVKLILIAFAIACPLSYYIMGKWLQNFAYRTGMSWWVFVLAGVVVLIISFATVTWQSWRAANRNPVEALRYE